MRNIFVILMVSLLLASCGGGSSSTDAITPTTASTTVLMAADFQTPIIPKTMNSLFKVTMCPVPSTSDSPMYAAGMDCDGDGGIVRYLTPSSFKVALKSLDFIKLDGSVVQIVPDTGTLANAQILDLSSPVTLSSTVLPEGTYPLVTAEIYYYEIVMPIDVPSVMQTIRVYLSDDDFPQEGSLGHHQGDITFVDATGERGWVAPGLSWTVANLLPNRGATVGAGGTDAETGHLRGLYGDASLWNQPTFVQGATQDIYKIAGPLNLTVGSTAQTVTFSFNVKDSWFFEDFDGNQLFNPCTGGASEACAAGAEWSPLFNAPMVIIQ